MCGTIELEEIYGKQCPLIVNLPKKKHDSCIVLLLLQA